MAYASSGAVATPHDNLEGAGVHHAAVKRCLKLFSGRLSNTPTPSLPRTDDMGLLLFLNLKQAHLKQATRHLDLYGTPILRPLLSIVEFVNYVVGGLIVEAEKVDEMHLMIKKEIVKREARMDFKEYDHKAKVRGCGSQLEQVLNTHFPAKGDPPLSVLRRQLASEEGPEAAAALRVIEDDKWIMKQLRKHLRVASLARSLLHGKVPGGVDPNEAEPMVRELGISSTFRKAMHRLRDALNEVEDKESLPALLTLTQFLDYLHYGVSVALDELENCELYLRKRSVGDAAEMRIHQLDMQDKMNKRASCSALRFNSVVNTPKKHTTVQQQYQQPQLMHPQQTQEMPPQQPQHVQFHSKTYAPPDLQQQEKLQPQSELSAIDDCFLNAYCCD